MCVCGMFDMVYTRMLAKGLVNPEIKRNGACNRVVIDLFTDPRHYQGHIHHKVV